MAKFQLTDVDAALSVLPETAVNTPYTADETDYVGGVMSATMIPFPQLGMVTSDEVGDGNEWADDQRPDYWLPQKPTIGGQLTTELAARLFLRGLGGTVIPATVLASVAFDHTAPMQLKSAGRTPKLSSLIMALGGADFLWPSMAVNGWECTFNANDPVQYSANLINTGYWRDMSADVSGVGVDSIPQETPHYMYPVQTRVTFNDGSSVDYATDGRLLSGRIGFSNNIVVRSLPGDPLLTALTPRSGAYARDIHRGRREAFASIKVSLDESFAEFTKLKAQADITSLKFLFKGDKIGASSHFYEFEINAPKCKMRVLTPDTDGDDAAMQIEFFIRRDTVSAGLLTGRIRNDQPTFV